MSLGRAVNGLCTAFVRPHPDSLRERLPVGTGCASRGGYGSLSGVCAGFGDPGTRILFGQIISDEGLVRSSQPDRIKLWRRRIVDHHGDIVS